MKENEIYVLHVNTSVHSKNAAIMTMQDRADMVYNISHYEHSPAFFHGHFAFLPFPAPKPTYINLVRWRVQKFCGYFSGTKVFFVLNSSMKGSLWAARQLLLLLEAWGQFSRQFDPIETRWPDDFWRVCKRVKVKRLFNIENVDASTLLLWSIGTLLGNWLSVGIRSGVNKF